MSAEEIMRWVLLGVGFALVMAIYIYERIKRDRHEEELEDLQAKIQPTAAVKQPAVKKAQSTPYPALETTAATEDSHRQDSQEPELPLAIERVEAWEQQADQDSSHLAEVNNQVPIADPVEPVLPREWLVVFNLMAPVDKPLRGDAIYQAVQQAGFEYGDMGIFHCFVTIGGEKKTLFSLANILEPGFFNLATINALSTRGVTLFMRLPGPLNHLAAFDEMVIRARKLARYLQVDLYDDRHQPLTPARLQEMKQQVLKHRQLYAIPSHSSHSS